MSEIEEFLDGFVRRRPGAMLSAATLHDRYVERANRLGDQPMSAKRFNREMKGRGYPLFRSAGRLVWIDVEMIDQHSLDTDDLGNSRAVMGQMAKGLRAAAAGRIPRFVAKPSIAADYASDPFYVRVPEVTHVITAGCKGVRFASEVPEGAAPAEEVIEALRGFLILFDQVIVVGGIVIIDGEGFPPLAFEEFIQGLLFRAVIVAPTFTADGAIEIEGRAFFIAGDKDRELLLALMAGEHHRFCELLKAHFVDPVWTLFQKQQWPGRSELFLSEVRRFRPAVKRYSSSDLGPVRIMDQEPEAA